MRTEWAPHDAHPSVREKVSLVTGRTAGYGAAREVLDLLMSARAEQESR